VEKSRVGPAHTVKGEGRGDRLRARSWRGLLVTLLAHSFSAIPRNYLLWLSAPTTLSSDKPPSRFIEEVGQKEMKGINSGHRNHRYVFYKSTASFSTDNNNICLNLQHHYYSVTRVAVLSYADPFCSGGRIPGSSRGCTPSVLITDRQPTGQFQDASIDAPIRTEHRDSHIN
jgi:hypothetical protein